MLFALILIPIAASLAVALSPAERAKSISTVGSLLMFVLTLGAMVTFDWSRGDELQFTGGIGFLPALGVELSVGADAISMWLIALTALLAPLCVIGSFTAISNRVRTYYAWLMALQGFMVGVFAAQDLVLFYICFEFTLVPMFVLIHLYGSTNRVKAATKFFLYTFTGSIFALAGLVYVAWHSSTLTGTWSFDFQTLASTAPSMSAAEQAWVLLALMAGFAVKVPLFPVHTWLPLAHTEAPTAGSVVLAGVLLKLGTYAIFRFVLSFVPLAVVDYAPFIAVLAIIGIIYAGLICWVQPDVKKLVAYSSVSHLGFCILGLFALNTVGMGGSVLYMINHGLSTGALFFCIGMMYERYHTRSLDEVGGLASKMPVWAFFMVFFTLASVGLPGLNGFVSEFTCLLGTFQSGADGIGYGGTSGPLGPWFAVVAGLGMVIAAIYLLYMVGLIVFGPLREPKGHHDEPGVLPTDLSPREIGILVPLALGCVILGVWPEPVMESLEAPIESARAVLVEANELREMPVPGSLPITEPVYVEALDLRLEGDAR